MCSVFDVDRQAEMERFLDIYGVEHPERMIFGRRRRPTQQVSIVTSRHGEPQVENAIWHLYLEKEGGSWKPHKKYWSINSNWKKLDSRPEYRKSRCLIPATAWVESLCGKHPVEFSYGEPYFFCGLYKIWGSTLSCSIITLDAHSATKIYHEKSLPMIAPKDSGFVSKWLSGSTHTDQFTDFLQPKIEYDHCQLTVRPVARATSTEYKGDPVIISK
ncbi:SOS response-associated peptidase family protein [Microbulbifer sp. SSSA007]|uniref:SOS response-associated peptidase family protein n=1 Tax=Microbulbifer sp. SSSA007 TaxID=3243379 RepID=UPI00403962D3